MPSAPAVKPGHFFAIFSSFFLRDMHKKHTFAQKL